MQTFRFLICMLAWASASILAVPARATLGEEFLPQSAKQAKPAGAMRVITHGKYTVNEYTLASGTVVREFMAPNHKVFAVAWKGPLKPDLRQLLGTYFERYIAAAANKPRPGRRPVLLRDPDSVIRATGHMHAFSGVAYLPGEMPAGVTEDELQ